MAKFDPSRPRAEVTFQCPDPCRWTFDAAPARVEDAPELEPHPFRYFATCPVCHREDVPQAPWERALQKAWLNATGPRTDEGKAASAANGKGHPTPEEAKRTRFNAMKHGLNARVATYFPAKPDGYPFCKTCKVDRDYCGAQAACVTKTELFMLHQAAFEQRDPSKLHGIYSDLQAGVFALIQTMVQQIIVDGVKFESVVWARDQEGEVKVAEYVDEKGERRILKESMEAHPLLARLGELLTRTGLSLADMGMTVKVMEQQQDEMGHLAGGKAEREGLSDFRRRQEAALLSLAEKVDRGRAATDRDPVLLEFNQDTGVHTPVAK